MQAQIRQLKSEQNFFKQSRSPDDENKIIQSIKSQLSEAKEALHIQNEDMERMQMNLQEKDDEIDKLREAIDEFDGDDEKVAFCCCLSFCWYVRFVISVFIVAVVLLLLVAVVVVAVVLVTFAFISAFHTLETGN